MPSRIKIKLFQGLTVRVEEGKLTVARILIDSIIDRQGDNHIFILFFSFQFELEWPGGLVSIFMLRFLFLQFKYRIIFFPMHFSIFKAFLLSCLLLLLFNNYCIGLLLLNLLFSLPFKSFNAIRKP
jgi:hypothetical protein